MIVYGDPAYQETMASLLNSLQARCRTVLSPASTAAHSLDELRSLLIECGQVETAVQDGLPGLLPEEECSRWIHWTEAMTAAAAAAFFRRWTGRMGAWVDGWMDKKTAPDVEPNTQRPTPSTERRTLNTALFHPPIHPPTPVPNVTLTVKRPEGFAFYALYPEQYCMAALQWAEDHPGCKEDGIVVIGIRSIGTALSAAVAAALIAHGWIVHRYTVRPSGHPFDRECHLPAEALRGLKWGLVVDEGPGISGSSMAAVGAALEQAGLGRQHISFLPGHGGEPGTAATAEVRERWAWTRRYVVSRDTLRWQGQSLPVALADAATFVPGWSLPVARTDDLGGGLWRRFVYPNPALWPAASIPLERPKFRCAGSEGPFILWQFVGLDRAPGGGSEAERAVARAAVLAREGWTVPPLGHAYGFIATPWVEGTPLSMVDRTPELLRHIGRYLARAAGPPLSPSDEKIALLRLQELLYWNVWGILGDEIAGRTACWKGWIEERTAQPTGRYGDGRMAPHEWLRTPAGAILKMDCLGHDNDHTAVGPQGLGWDMAGAWIEWELDEVSAEPLLEGMEEGGAPAVDAQTLLFHRMAYAAFRAGQCSLCAASCVHDPEETKRLWAAFDRYRDALSALLSTAAGT